MINYQDLENPWTASLSQAKRPEKELSFMADNSIRQLVNPRIGEYADCQRPEAVHNETNAWQHLLNVFYQEALRRELTEDFFGSSEFAFAGRRQ